MLMMSFPVFVAPLVVVLLAVMVVGLIVNRRRTPDDFESYDVDRELADLTLKVRKPWQYRAMRMSRWMDGE